MDLYRVHAGWNYILPVTTIEDEVLSAQLEDVRIGPSRADALEAVDCEIAAAAIRPRPVAVVDVVRIRIEHAEAALRRFPYVTVAAYQPILGVMLEVEMLMAARKLEQSVRVAEVAVTVRIHVRERAPDEYVAFADVRRRDREADDRVSARRDTTLDDAAEIRRQILHPNDPVVLRRLPVDDEIWQRTRVGHAAREQWFEWNGSAHRGGFTSGAGS